MKSVWSLATEKHEELKKDINSQIAVVGGGIAGYLTAFKLSELGFEVVLIEAKRLFGGTTINTTASINALQGIVYSDLEKRYNLQVAKTYFNSQQWAIKQYSNLIKKYNIECNFKLVPSYLFARKKTKKLLKEFNILTKINAKVKYYENFNKLPFKVDGAIELKNQACFHPIKFLKGLPVNFKIYENSRVLKADFKRKILYTKNASIKADKIVIATHFPFFNFPKMFFLKMYQSTSYCKAFEAEQNVNGLYVENTKNGITLRDYENKIIIGGGGHRTASFKKNSGFTTINKAAEQIEGLVELTNSWLTEDCMTFDGLAYAGKLAKKYSDCYVITGFNKWGMANSYIASSIVANFIANKQNQYADLFKLDRHWLLNSKKNFAANFLKTTKNLLKSILSMPLKSYKKLEKGDGGIFIVKGKKRAVYKDENGKYYMLDARCAHLKCLLNFNKYNKMFECPCHGSRFDIEGNIISEPTVKKLNKH